MPLELQCLFCPWHTEGYSEDMLEKIEEAKEHAKKHKVPWKMWAIQGKVIHEMFKVVSIESDKGGKTE